MCQERGFGHRKVDCCEPHFRGKGMPPFMHMFRKHIKNCFQMFGGGIPYNVEDLGESYTITIPLAGRTKEDVKVSLINNYLNIKAPKPEFAQKKSQGTEAQEKDPGFLWKMFLFIDVNIDIPLPADANIEAIKSAMSNGVLKIKIGKKPSKNINIDDENN